MGLKNISPLISPELLYVLSSMGHGDDIVLADIHFPTSALCRHGPKEIRADGIKVPPLLEAILQLLPLDTYAPPASVMDMVAVDKKGPEPEVWQEYERLINKFEAGRVPQIALERVERFQFYERAKNAFAIVHTGETAKYGNLILKKGLVAYTTVDEPATAR